MGIFKFPKWAIKLINSQLAHYFWDNYEGHHKYHLASWGGVPLQKQHGGLGVPNIADMNLCLLGSWVKRYFLDQGKIWKQVIDAKYNTHNLNIFACSNLGASPFWKGILWATKAANIGYSWIIGDGKSIRFWRDRWIGHTTLATKYWNLYSMPMIRASLYVRPGMVQT